MRALLIVDLQKDFCPGGQLAVPEGDRVVPVINQIISEFPLVIASKDWHPEDSSHFDDWPVHCVQNTEGAEFHDDLNQAGIEKVFLKGTDEKKHGYSVFAATSDDLEDFLSDSGVDELYLAGLATEYCVKETALEAAKRGFQTFIIEEAVAGIDEDDIEEARKELKEVGVNFISIDEL